MQTTLLSATDTVTQASKTFSPSENFILRARLKNLSQYQALYHQSIENPEAFWAAEANELHWFKPWKHTLDDSKKPFFSWFTEGKTNLSYNCLDRHLNTQTRNKAAIIFEGEPGDERVLTYHDLHREVCRFANVLLGLGLEKGDTVAIYMPMVPELAIALLACARIGVIHSVIFGGFSSEAIRDRVLDARSKCVITMDGGYRRGKFLPLKEIVDAGVAPCPCVKHVLVLKRHRDTVGRDCPMTPGRDVWYHEATARVTTHRPAVEMDAEDMLFLLYTSGSTGKPKGIMHTTGGYMTHAYATTKYTFDMQAEDVFWCTADIGWVTGHSYVVYGPLLNGATVFMYEGAPDWPNHGRYWQLIEKYGVTIFYTAPTAIRAFMKWGDEWPAQSNLTSLRLLGSVGEPINPEAWLWYNKNIGFERCPIVDTWWQTETGGIMITPVPGCIPTKPGSATLPFFGIDAAVLDEEGNPSDHGLLAIRKPWPGMLRGIYGDTERYVRTYWSKWGGKYYFAGDGAIRDQDGYFWITGRVDDVVNVSGHRIGTAELEAVFIENHAVAESAVIGASHELKGQTLIAFVILKSISAGIDENWLRNDLNRMIETKIGKFARPEAIVFVPDLPKTRSGKIMRRLLRDIAEHRELGNVTTLADPAVVEAIRERFARLKTSTSA
ncbi:MAG: acetate--CoA ligase [Puniceicoccales bacterium]|jgi:acetyl-CoA synthetase|nr:acetate--CoA ligase [Puniceicoccales bacterium]